MQESLNHRYNGRLYTNSNEYNTKRQKLESGIISKDSYIAFLSSTKQDSNFLFNFVLITAASIIIDGEHQELEKVMTKEMCSELNLNYSDFSALLDKEVGNMKDMDYELLVKYLKSKLIISDLSNNYLLFESAMHIILSDGIMTLNECNLLADLGSILNISTGQILARLSLFIRKEQQILIDIENTINWRSISGIVD